MVSTPKLITPWRAKPGCRALANAARQPEASYQAAALEIAGCGVDDVTRQPRDRSPPYLGPSLAQQDVAQSGVVEGAPGVRGFEFNVSAGGVQEQAMVHLQDRLLRMPVFQCRHDGAAG